MNNLPGIICDILELPEFENKKLPLTVEIIHVLSENTIPNRKLRRPLNKQTYKIFHFDNIIKSVSDYNGRHKEKYYENITFQYTIKNTDENTDENTSYIINVQTRASSDMVPYLVEYDDSYIINTYEYDSGIRRIKQIYDNESIDRYEAYTTFIIDSTDYDDMENLENKLENKLQKSNLILYDSSDNNE